MRERARGRLPGAALAAAAAVLLLAAAGLAEEPVPPYAGFVTDRAGVMDRWRDPTEALCRDVEARTGAEIAVLTVKTTGPDAPQSYAQRVFDTWKIGKKGKDNGILILVAVDDRKVWIATGYGVEGILPDGKVGAIRDATMIPFFRQGRYGEGIYRGAEAIGSVLSGGEAGAPREARKKRRRIPVAALVLLGIIALFTLPVLFGGPHGSFRRRRTGWYGGPWGGYRGGFGGGGFGGGGFGGFGGGSSGGGGAGGGW